MMYAKLQFPLAIVRQFPSKLLCRRWQSTLTESQQYPLAGIRILDLTRIGDYFNYVVVMNLLFNF